MGTKLSRITRSCHRGGTVEIGGWRIRREKFRVEWEEIVGDADQIQAEAVDRSRANRSRTIKRRSETHFPRSRTPQQCKPVTAAPEASIPLRQAIPPCVQSRTTRISLRDTVHAALPAPLGIESASRIGISPSISRHDRGWNRDDGPAIPHARPVCRCIGGNRCLNQTTPFHPSGQTDDLAVHARWPESC